MCLADKLPESLLTDVTLDNLERELAVCHRCDLPDDTEKTMIEDNTTPMDEMLDNLIGELHAMTTSQHTPLADRIAKRVHALALVVQDTRRMMRASDRSEIAPPSVNLHGDIVARGPNKTSTEMLDEVARALGWRTDWTCGDSPITWDAVIAEIARRSVDQAEHAQERVRRTSLAVDLMKALGMPADCGPTPTFGELLEKVRRCAQAQEKNYGVMRKRDEADLAKESAQRKELEELVLADEEVIVGLRREVRALKSEASKRERDARQAKVFAWARETFGVNAVSVPQRGIRLLEEALEAYQAAGCDQTMAHELVDFVFKRPVGELAKEIGGVGVCALALAASAGLHADYEEGLEVERVLAKPAEEWRARHVVKAAVGLAQAPSEAS